MDWSETHIESIAQVPTWINTVARLTRRLPAGRHRIVESFFGKSSRRFIANMIPELGGYSFDCCLRDQSARTVFFTGCHARQEIAFLRGTLLQGMTFVDVGANWGLFSLIAAHLVGAGGHIVALEPDPRIFAMLQANVKRNKLSQIVIHRDAAADSDARMILAAHDQSDGNWAISRLVGERTDGQPSFVVNTRRVDELLDEAGIGSVDLLKMDVEGAEDLALTGMTVGLKEHRYQRIIMELHPPQLAERGRTTSEIIAALQRYGYRGYVFDYTLPAMRNIYYHPNLPYSQFILPLDRGLALGLRHTVWISPELPSLEC
jgi:FkbM family methyltransferase